MGFFGNVVQGFKNITEHPFATFKAAVSKEDPYSLRHKAGLKELGKDIALSVGVGGAAVVGTALLAPEVLTLAGARTALTRLATSPVGKGIAKTATIAGAVNLGAGRNVLTAKDVIGFGLNPYGYAAGKFIHAGENLGNLTPEEKILTGVGITGALGGAGYGIYKYLKGKNGEVTSVLPNLLPEPTLTSGNAGGLTTINPMASKTGLGETIKTESTARRRRYHVKVKQQALNIRNINRNEIRISQRSRNVINRTNTSKRTLVMDKAESYNRN